MRRQRENRITPSEESFDRSPGDCFRARACLTHKNERTEEGSGLPISHRDVLPTWKKSDTGRPSPRSCSEPTLRSRGQESAQIIPLQMFMVLIHVHCLENFPAHEPTPFPNSRTKNERDGRGRFEGPHCGAFALVLVLRPSSVDGDEQHTDLCAGTHGARFMVTIQVHSLENFPAPAPPHPALSPRSEGGRGWPQRLGEGSLRFQEIRSPEDGLAHCVNARRRQFFGVKRKSCP